jgi:hypothetical protein
LSRQSRVKLATPRVGQFFRARRAKHYANLLTPRAVVPLVGHLRQMSVMGDPPAVVASSPVEVLVERFRVYLVSERALVDGTVRFNLHVARLFVSERLSRDGLRHRQS